MRYHSCLTFRRYNGFRNVPIGHAFLSRNLSLTCTCTRSSALSYLRVVPCCRLIRHTARLRSPPSSPFGSASQRCGISHIRSQHTQAVLIPDTSDGDNEIEEIERDAEEIEDVQDADPAEEDQSADDQDEDAEINIVELLRQHVEKPSVRLFYVVGKYLPRAVPTISVSYVSGKDETGHSQHARHVYRADFTNVKYDISISNHVTFLDQSKITFKPILEGLARTYNDILATKLEANDIMIDTIEPIPMNAVRKILKIGRIKLECAPSDSMDYGIASSRLFVSQAYAGNTPMAQQQIWYKPVMAQRLARLSADAATVQYAEAEGLDLDTVREHATSRTIPVKQKDTPFELPRVTDRETPRTYHASISEETLSVMVHTLRELREAGLPDEVPLMALTQLLPIAVTVKHDLWARSAAYESSILEEKNKTITPELERIRSQRDQLPIRTPGTAKLLLQTIIDNDVVVLVSETGSGKTTQLPQLLLERATHEHAGAGCNIICTQPRRMAATSVATRVADELGTRIGEHVGYRVRFDSQPPTKLGSVSYVTAGVLLKTLQEQSESVLNEHSHIIIDEIHERSLPTDILLTFLRDLLRRRKSQNMSFPKIILMSATMKSSDFEQYFAEPNEQFTPKVAAVNIPGRTFPVTSYMLEDIMPTLADKYANQRTMIDLLRESKSYVNCEDAFVEQMESRLQTRDKAVQNLCAKFSMPKNPQRDAIIPYGLITATIAHICKVFNEGDILVFLPGMKEIEMVSQFLQSRLSEMHNLEKVRLFKLHAAFQDMNSKVFDPIPEGCRRIILSTNIAQTSITLPGVSHVIDSGKQRVMSYDQISRRSTFDCVWIDRATSTQRKGRAGRVRHGYYWAMFTKTRLEAMSEMIQSEIRTSDLTTSSLVLKSYSDAIDLQKFFAHTLDAPDPQTVSACIQELQELGMLTACENITPLGQFCSDFPLHPAKARGLLLGLLFRCFQPLMLVACHGTDTPLINAASDRVQSYHSNLAFAGTTDDDRSAFIRAFQQYDKAMGQCQRRDAEILESKHVDRNVYDNMLNIARQIYEIMSRYGFFPDSDVLSLNNTSNVFRLTELDRPFEFKRVDLFKALALGVVNTNLAVWDEEQSSWLAKDIKCILRPYSVNTKTSLKLTKRDPYRRDGEIIGYGEMLRNTATSTRPYLIESSTITPLTAMLFGGPISVLEDGTIEIDGWLRYKVDVKPSRDKYEASGADHVSAALTILEFRKALDRFTTLAFQDLRKGPPRNNRLRRHRRETNRLFQPHPLRSHMRVGLACVLRTDAEHWDKVLVKT